MTFWDPSVRAQLAARIGKLEAQSSPTWGRMTAHQMVCHLGDSFRLALGERPQPRVGNRLIAFVAKLVVLRWQLPMPRNAPTMPGLNQRRGGTRPTTFDGDVRALLELMERFGETRGRLSGTFHPLFWELTPDEWSAYAVRHTDHHLRQFGV